MLGFRMSGVLFGGGGIIVCAVGVGGLMGESGGDSDGGDML